MRIQIIPYDVHETINRELDQALEEWPEAIPDRELFYQQLVDYYDEYGDIPRFHIAHVVPKLTFQFGPPRLENKDEAG